MAVLLSSLPSQTVAEEPPAFVSKYCLECHDSEMKKGGLDLSILKPALHDPKVFNTWVKIHDRIQSGEMPPKKKARPESRAKDSFLKQLSSDLTREEQLKTTSEGRSTRRRLNRYEYENALRDLLGAPWLQIKDMLPEDGEAFRFNKVGDALDVSHVQMARYLNAAETALRLTMAPYEKRPDAKPIRYHTRDQRSYTGPMKFSVFNTAPERATFPVLGFKGQPAVRAGDAPITVGETNAELRELEGVGVVASAYEPIEPKFNQFRAPVAGRYRLKFNGYSVWVGPGQTNKWFIPNLDDISKGRRPEPITVYTEVPPNLLRRIGEFDVTTEPAVHELDVHLLAGETIRPDAVRFFRSRPGAARWQNPLAEKDGQPGVVFRWLEVEGPIFDQWPPAGHTLMFGNLPFAARKSDVPPEETTATTRTNRADGTRRGDRRFRSPSGVEINSSHPEQDAPKLLAGFIAKAYRRPSNTGEVDRFLPVIHAAMKRGASFTDAMIAGYTAVLCSPEFLYLQETPGPLDDYALASRLAFFLWNSPPDEALLRLAREGKLRRPATLKAQSDRMLADPKARSFVDAFLDYWLELRKINATAPDSELYPDYYLDDWLTESALAETQLFFTELIRGDLPARNLIDSDFAMLNERLAAHYGLPRLDGTALRKVKLPRDSNRGGILTQASILKVTANGTTTSPVLRGSWIVERIFGDRPPPPPPGVSAVEPDLRGAVTIRQQLDKHRSVESCATCHVKIDPPGFALENFDVMGGWRDRYRASGNDAPPEPGIAKSGQKFAFHYALPVDAAGQTPDGRTFQDIRQFKRILLANEERIARNVAQQLIIYSTGAPIRFSDRPQVAKILAKSKTRNYGIKTLITEIVQSDLFLNK